MENKYEIVQLNYMDSLEKFELSFLESYCADIYQSQWIVFKEDAHFDVLDLDKLAKESSAILFEKDLLVRGVIVQEQADYGPLVIVKGNTYAQNIFVGGCELFFRGNVTVDQTIIGVYNHGTIHIRGYIKAELIVNDDHSFNISTKQIKKGATYGLDEKSESIPTDIFKSKFYDKYDERLDSSAILEAMLQGKSIKREGKILSPLEKAFFKFENSKKKLLDLSSLDLTEIPEQVFHLKDVLELDLSANYIKELPIELLQLKQLKNIRLYNCEFTEFPIILLEISTLEEIDLGENAIENLPSGISKLSHLKKLHLYNCSFDYFPKEVYSIPNLEVLDISYQENQPAFVIDKVFTRLKTLNISANFGATITVLQPNLENLNMRNCSLAEIPTALLGSLKMKSLDITLNPITSLPKEITNLKKTVHLSLPINYLDEQSIKLLHDLPRLSKLTLEFANEIAPISTRYFLEIEQWKELYCEGCLQDQFLIKEILQRPNLKKLVSVKNEEEVMDIKKARSLFGISI